jgi:endo-1,4-beta-xylanase
VRIPSSARPAIRLAVPALIAAAAVFPATNAGAGVVRGRASTVRLWAGRPPGTLVFKARSIACPRGTKLKVLLDGRRLGVVRPRPHARLERLVTSAAAGWHSVRFARSGKAPRRSACRISVRRPRFRARAIPLGAAVRESALGDTPYATTVGAYFDSLTPENEMKMAFLQPERGRFEFRFADHLVAFAAAHGKAVRGHTLVYGDQLPAWVEHPLVPWTRAELLDVMRRHIETVMAHYRGRVRTWDVVNEPIGDQGGYRPNIWYRVIGPDYVEQAFRFARAADPSARLYLNEAAAERPSAKATTLYAAAADFKRRGVPLDGIGFQNHTTAPGNPTRAELERSMRRYAALGLKTEITEMDVVTPPGPSRSRLRAQARAFAAAAAACRAVRSCARLTTWGVSDRITWKEPGDLPLLFDTDFGAKPSYVAVARRLASR